MDQRNDPKISTGKSWPQIYTILAVCLNTISTGQLISWPSPSIPILTSTENPSRITIEEGTYLAIIPSITTIVASPCVAKLIDIVGRKYAVLCVTISYILSWTLTSIGGSLYIYYAARLLDGIGDACCFSSIPCYISEISTPRVRGTWGNSISLSIYFGQFVMNVLGAYFTITNAAYISLALPIAFLGNFCLLPESPYYQVMKGNIKDARKSLQWLRGTQNVEQELTQLISDVQRQLSEQGRLVDLFLITSNRRACLIGILIRACQQFTGSSAFTVYAQTIFIESGSDLSPSMSAIVFTGILTLNIFVASFFLEKLGRRTAMMISCMGSCIVLFGQTAFFYIQDETDIAMDGFQVFPLVSMITFVPVYSLGLGLVPTLMLGELFSSSIKSYAFMLMNIFFGISIASSAKIFAACLQFAGMYAAFLFLACCSLVSIFVSYFIVPETKGKTLEEIQQGFKK